MDLLDVNLLIILVLVDIVLSLLFRWQDLDKPEPLSSLQYFHTQYQLREDLEKIINEDKKEVRTKLFEAYLQRKDILRELKNGKDE